MHPKQAYINLALMVCLALACSSVRKTQAQPTLNDTTATKAKFLMHADGGVGLWIPTNKANTYGTQSMLSTGINYTFLNKHKVLMTGEIIGHFTAPNANEYLERLDTTIQRKPIGSQFFIGYSRVIYKRGQWALEANGSGGSGRFLSTSFIINPGLYIDYIHEKLNHLRIKLNYYFVDYVTDPLNNFDFSGNAMGISVCWRTDLNE
ncbi:MAG: hypothetical protein ACK417_05250 [Bacteroidia bacterium]